MNKQLHARKRRQFKSLSKQLNRLLQGEHTRASKQKIEAIMLKIKHLIRELSGIIARWEMKKTLGAAAVMFGLATASVQGQPFAEPIENPFELTSSELFGASAFIDIDADGDVDILVGLFDYYTGSNIVYYENVGTASEPTFAQGQTSPFGIQLSSSYLIFPSVADLDGDGDMDVFLNTGENETGIFKYYENTGTPTDPSFAAVQNNPFGLIPNTYYFSVPTFADIDDDGDIDLLAGTYSYSYVGGNYYYANFLYYENTGDAANPQFANPVDDPFNLSFPANTASYLPFPAFTDLDKDGDIDILVGNYGATYYGSYDYAYGGIFYFENTGSPTAPQFEVSERNPFGIIAPQNPLNEYNVMIPALADLDDDGDTDILTGAWYGGFHYFENLAPPVSITTPQADFPVNISPNPTNHYLNINTDEPLSQIEIYDLFGRQLATYNGQQTQISIQDLSSGTYVIRLINNEGQYLSKRIEKL